MIEAYLDCRRRKRGTTNAIRFELDLENELVRLVDEVNNRSYAPSRSIAFIVSHPRYREVFAADFRDRVIHHYLILRLNPFFESVFSPNAFNCRAGKGTLYGVNRLRQDVDDCSRNGTVSCYGMKLDLSGFFMSIDKYHLYSLLAEFVIDRYDRPGRDDILYLIEVILMHEPEKDCIIRCSPSLWNHLSANKSLFTNEDGCGLPIGNLPSQIFANFLLTSLDWYVSSLGLRYYGRYVDDFYILHNDKSVLLSSVGKIRDFLSGQLHLRLHPRKFSLQYIGKGIEFTGVIIRPWSAYVHNRVVCAFVQSVMRLNCATDLTAIRQCIESVNSYLGTLNHYDTYAIRRRYLSTIEPRLFEYLDIVGHFNLVRLKKRYSERECCKRMLRERRFYRFVFYQV